MQMSHPADQEVIAAIREGDVDRYRELIERYQRHAYAVAWSRLGDATLAEEAVQESFIRAFRFLRWLRDPARFAGWITRITRGVSINLGLRHRRELRRRERWALDPGSTSSESGNPAGAAAPTDVPQNRAETLRSALADLPARHRECLVLHYLEGRTVADSALGLGITEGAFKVRLHRARAALRSRLERELGDSLGRIGPRRSLVTAVMSSSAVKAAATDPGGVGTGLLAGLGATIGKLLPAPFLIFLMPLLILGLGFGTAAWTQRIERRNYREPEGFRARLHDDSRRLSLDRSVWIGLAVVTLIAIPAWLGQGYGVFLALVWPLVGAMVVGSIRQYRLDGLFARHVHALTGLPILLALTGGLVWNIPGWVTGLAFGLQFLGIAIWPVRRPLRHDYNLFLRDRTGLLPPAEAPCGAPGPVSWEQRRAFARLLAREQIVVASLRRSRGFVLKLHPITPGLFDWLGPWILPGDSTITLHEDGRITARLGRRDLQQLARLSLAPPDSPSVTTPAESEGRVAQALNAALRNFLDGSQAEALRLLGHRPTGEIFKVEPTRTLAFRLQHGAGALGLGVAAWMVFNSLWNSPFQPGRMTHLRPVALSTPQARADFIQSADEALSRTGRRWELMDRSLYSGFVLPPPDWGTEAARVYMRTNLLAGIAFLGPGSPGQVEVCLIMSPIARAVEFGWLTTQDLASVGITPAAVRAAVPLWTGRVRSRILAPEAVAVSGQSYSVLNVEDFRWRLTLLRRLECLDLVDAPAVVAQLRAHQILPGNPPVPGRKPDLDRDNWHGLFATFGWDPIRDTHGVLACLEILGAIHAIDAAACAHELLRFHQGRGLFLASLPFPKPFSRVRPATPARAALAISGDAPTTYAAWDSLRILGALGQVADLGTWEFRPQARAMVLANDAGGQRRIPSWEEIEAVLLRDRVAVHPEMARVAKPEPASQAIH